MGLSIKLGFLVSFESGLLSEILSIFTYFYLHDDDLNHDDWSNYLVKHKKTARY